MVERGRVRVNARRVTKSSAAVGPGDVLTLAQGDRVRVVQVLGLPLRRGPAAEAQALYLEFEEKSVSSG
jgi:ribosome-associated heat shock protein Hsp15